MRTLTYEDAVTYLDRAVAEKGYHYVYKPPNMPTSKTCYYFGPDEKDKPGCIIGHVFFYMGITHTDLVKADPSRNLNANSVAPVLKYLGIKADLRTRTLLAQVQGLQDQQQTWGKAVAEAKKFTEKILEEALV